MGNSNWSTTDWDSYSTRTSAKPAAAIFTKHSMVKDLNPLGVKVRESRDSDANPNSTPIIVAVDVTGSMGVIAENLVKKGIGVLFEEILKRKPVTDPSLMIMAIGDAACDRAPLQVSQFESDLKIAEWLEQIYVEGGGGGNNHESYDLPYYFAARHTSTDCFEKRGKKGFLFTIGDEESPLATRASQVKKFIGDDLNEDIPMTEVIRQAQKMYECFHIIIAEGSHASSNPTAVKNSWNAVLGERAIWLTDYTKLSEVIVSLIQMISGETKDEIIKSWSGITAVAVRDALAGYGGPGTLIQPDGIRKGGVVRL